jgi:quercetin dioxygenase-like cupin family protein
MAFCSIDERASRQLFDGILARTYWGSNILLSRVEMEADALAPSHSHPHEQAGVVLSGEMDFTIAGETRTLHSGDMYIVPGGVEHEARAGAEGCVALDIFSPVRESLQY